jgi:hypothetical protein
MTGKGKEANVLLFAIWEKSKKLISNAFYDIIAPLKDGRKTL